MTPIISSGLVPSGVDIEGEREGRHTPPYELRFHGAMPGWAKVTGLAVRPIPKWEGGGFAIPEFAGRAIVAHDDLVAALQQAHEAIKSAKGREKSIPMLRIHNEALVAIRAALSKAGAS